MFGFLSSKRSSSKPSSKRPKDTVLKTTYKGHRVHKGSQGAKFIVSKGQRVYLASIKK